MCRLIVTFLLVAGILVLDVDGGRRRRRRRTVIHQHTHHHSTNNCNCYVMILKLQKELAELKKKLGKRDVAAILDLDVDYPGLDQFVQHVKNKRDVDINDLEAVIKRSTHVSSSHSPNICHCGRSLVDQFNLESVY